MAKKNREKICQYCGKTFTLKPLRGGANRMPCYREGCVAEHKEYMRVKTAQASAEWRKRYGMRRTGKNARVCSICGDPLPENRWFYHEACYHRQEDLGRMPRADGDFAYV